MLKCPRCKESTDKILNEWNYYIFHVKNYHCPLCNKNFKAYFKDGKLSHIINNSISTTQSTTQRKIIGYLEHHEEANTDEIAKALHLKIIDVLKVLQKMEKRGTVTIIE
jgi:hypothetical protein